MTAGLSKHAQLSALGIAFGFALSFIGFSDWGEVHRMFTFQDLRLVLVFGGAVTVNAIALNLLVKDARRVHPKPLHRGTIIGGVLFGLGWALCGACPSIVLVQLGEGQVPALATLVGVLAGTSLYGAVHARWFRWDSGGCDI